MMTQILKKDKNQLGRLKRLFSRFWRKPATLGRIFMELFLNEKVVNFPPEWVADFAGISNLGLNSVPFNERNDL